MKILQTAFKRGANAKFIKILREIAVKQEKDELFDEIHTKNCTFLQIQRLLYLLNIKVKCKFRSIDPTFKEFVTENPDLEFNLLYVKGLSWKFTELDIKTKFKHTQKLFDAVKKRVVGQDVALKRLITAIEIHRTLMQGNENLKLFGRHNLFLQGKTGTGKTFLIKNLCEELKIPFVNFDASRLTSEGYIGQKIHDITDDLKRQLKNYNKPPEMAIILLDEIDKIATVEKDKSNVNTYGAQRNLLKFLEDTTLDGFDYTRALIILAGSFSALEESEKGRKSIGFNVSDSDDLQQHHFNQEKLIKAGLIPELAGRMGQIVCLEPLTDDAYELIIHNAVRKYRTLASHFNKKFKLEPEIIQQIIKQCNKLEIGARAVNSEVAERFNKLVEDNLFTSTTPTE